MIRYTDSLGNVKAGDLRGFFEGWRNPPSPEMHLRLLAGSDEIVLAIDEKTNNVVGFVTALTDNVLSAYIQLVEVLPEYHGQGIGRELMRLMLDKLSGLYMIDTVCDEDMKDFYGKLGMEPADAMVFRRYEYQCGKS